VASIATLRMRHWVNQSAKACKSAVRVLKDRTELGSRSGGTATKWAADPQSTPAASGWRRSSTETRRRGVVDDGGMRRGMGDSLPVWAIASAIRDVKREQSPKRDHGGGSVASPVMKSHVPGPR
jgi:hypothetical protein